MNEVKYKTRIIMIVLILCCIFLVSFPLNAQLRTRTAIDSANAQSNGYWYNPSHYQFEVQYPVLKAIPPVSPDMDKEIYSLYISLDSLMKEKIPNDKFDLTTWKKQKVKNDTIVAMVKYLYRLRDFDPIRFNQYKHSLKSSFYKNNLMGLQGQTVELLSNIVMNTPYEFCMNDLNCSDYILKVQVNNIESLPWISHPNKFIYKVNAYVLDTLKGKVFKNCNDNQNLENKNFNEKPLISNANICFTYVTGSYSNTSTNRKIDKSLLNSNGNLSIIPGQELIVTLSHYDYLWDYGFDYFNLTLLTVLPIINGQVQDIGHVWSTANALNYSDWKDAFQKKKDMLLNGGY